MKFLVPYHPWNPPARESSSPFLKKRKEKRILFSRWHSTQCSNSQFPIPIPCRIFSLSFSNLGSNTNFRKFYGFLRLTELTAWTGIIISYNKTTLETSFFFYTYYIFLFESHFFFSFIGSTCNTLFFSITYTCYYSLFSSIVEHVSSLSQSKYLFAKCAKSVCTVLKAVELVLRVWLAIKLNYINYLNKQSQS